VTDIAALVAESADAAGLHATVPALLIELQTELGALSAVATAATERGRRPFRPAPGWEGRLGTLGYGLYLLADQSGVNLADQIEAVAAATRTRAEQQQRSEDSDWPFKPN